MLELKTILSNQYQSNEDRIQFVVDYILNSDPALLVEVGTSGNAAYFYIVSDEHLSIEHKVLLCELLVDKNIQDMPNHFGVTALMLAVHNGPNYFNVIEKLIEVQGSIDGINHKDDTGNTVLSHAAIVGNTRILDYLCQHGASSTQGGGIELESLQSVINSDHQNLLDIIITNNHRQAFFWAIKHVPIATLIATLEDKISAQRGMIDASTLELQSIILELQSVLSEKFSAATGIDGSVSQTDTDRMMEALDQDRPPSTLTVLHDPDMGDEPMQPISYSLVDCSILITEPLITRIKAISDLWFAPDLPQATVSGDIMDDQIGSDQWVDVSGDSMDDQIRPDQWLEMMISSEDFDPKMVCDWIDQNSEKVVSIDFNWQVFLQASLEHGHFSISQRMIELLKNNRSAVKILASLPCLHWVLNTKVGDRVPFLEVLLGNPCAKKWLILQDEQGDTPMMRVVKTKDFESFILLWGYSSSKKYYLTLFMLEGCSPEQIKRMRDNRLNAGEEKLVSILFELSNFIYFLNHADYAMFHSMMINHNQLKCIVETFDQYFPAAESSKTGNEIEITQRMMYVDQCVNLGSDFPKSLPAAMSSARSALLFHQEKAGLVEDFKRIESEYNKR